MSKIITWQKLRLLLLIIQIMMIILVIVKLIFGFSNAHKTVDSWQFPSLVPLNSWQLVKSQFLVNSLNKKGEFQGEYVSGIKYRYQKKELSLYIETIYFINSNGDLRGLIKEKENYFYPTLKHQKNIGFYSLFINQNTAHLTACINPRGYSTVTGDQFKENYYYYNLRFQRLILWLFTKQSLWDKRCLWSHLFMPIENSSSEKITASLEEAWFDWYDWWKKEFSSPYLSKLN